MAVIERRPSAWWQILLAGIGLVLAVTVAFLTVSSVIQGRNAIRAAEKSATAAKSATDSEQQLRTAAIARVNSLNAEIQALSAQASTNAGHIARLLTEVQALDAQIEALGGKPVVVETVAPSPAGASTQTASRNPTPSTAPSRTPGAPSPSAVSTFPVTSSPTPAKPSPTPLLCLLGACL